MVRYIVLRIASAVPTMGFVALFVFGLLHLTPGDPAVLIAGDYATAAQVEDVRRRLGLDQPIATQFIAWLGQILRGDLGVSIFSNLPVTTLIRQRLEPTILLAIFTTLISTAIAVPLGIVAAWRVGSAIDRLLMGASVLGFSTPVFVLGYCLIYLFAVQLEWLPVQGFTPISAGFGPFLKSIVLPSAALGAIYVALLARMTRASMVEALAEDYVRTARAKGLSNRTVLMIHALKNAAAPIITTIGASVALLLGGVVVTESVFNIPGLGRLTADAITRRDYPVIQGVVLLFSAIYVGVNLMIDLLYTLVDPRIRY